MQTCKFAYQVKFLLSTEHTHKKGEKKERKKKKTTTTIIGSYVYSNDNENIQLGYFRIEPKMYTYADLPPIMNCKLLKKIFLRLLRH